MMEMLSQNWRLRLDPSRIPLLVMRCKWLPEAILALEFGSLALMLSYMATDLGTRPR